MLDGVHTSKRNNASTLRLISSIGRLNHSWAASKPSSVDRAFGLIAPILVCCCPPFFAQHD